MTATVEFTDGTLATVNDGRWRSKDRRAQQLLNDFSRTWEPEPGYVPDYDLALARDAALHYGGEVVAQDDPPEPVEGVVP